MARLLETKNRKKSNFYVTIFTVILALFGVAMVFSASYYQSLSKFGNYYHYVKDDLMWLGIGMAAFIICGLLNYHIYSVFAWPLLGIGVVLLLLIFTPLGITLNNATRWLDFKYFTVMPGEIIKSCLVFWIASFYAKDPDRIHRLKPNAAVLAVLAFCAALIVLQPNLSTAGTVVLIGIGMMFIAGFSLKLILLVGALGVGGFVLIILSPKGAYMLERVETFFDPFKDALGSGYQVVQGLLALGSGGFLGVGPGQSIQKTLYLPEPQNDFIIAIIGEELGFVGVLALLLVYLMLIYNCFKVAMGAKDYFGMLLAGGITLHLAIQVILNVAVVSASFFPTGVALPLVSLGGNATVLFLAEMGIIVNISKHTIDEIEAEA
ncbi:MAG: FtsW/RodA/SpoVE family cell cycle protein [Firmicutes bacterium]|nr:FtsW/RodA/SpoVE family cell cycle protein [Bacillota bacterium]